MTSHSLLSRRSVLAVVVLTITALFISKTYPFHLLTFLFGILSSILITDSLLWDALRFLSGTLPKPEIPVQFSLPASEVGGLKYTYGLDHGLLNARLDTLWLNMGYWREAKGFQEACEALARLVGDGGQIQKGDKVLDFGYGCGDQLLFWHRTYTPSLIVGVTSEPLQACVAHTRIQTANLSHQIRPFLGDAIHISNWKPLDKGSTKILSENDYDVVLSLDSCYHYTTRVNFLRLAASKLKPNGRLSISDFLLGTGFKSASFTTRMFMRVALKGVGVPEENLVEEHVYNRQMEDAGFEDVEVRDITEYVFPGLAGFIGEQRRRVGGLVDVDRKWRQYEFMRRALITAYEKKLLRFVVVSAMRRSC
ncbi:hypothetical protein HK097_008461 [Rhizophlyctis rosea]|uniref:phosphoethanolamine N-methyltransferase n=1 Tax=Rhizophlyctis rosea TaxID=64517 RepID=A0AAD5SLT4_9FUNG|nr:hypothetical protein HK097_008461 [Rhizophlyctis rosea]